MNGKLVIVGNAAVQHGAAKRYRPWVIVSVAVWTAMGIPAWGYYRDRPMRG